MLAPVPSARLVHFGSLQGRYVLVALVAEAINALKWKLGNPLTTEGLSSLLLLTDAKR